MTDGEARQNQQSGGVPLLLAGAAGRPFAHPTCNAFPCKTIELLLLLLPLLLLLLAQAQLSMTQRAAWGEENSTKA